MLNKLIKVLEKQGKLKKQKSGFVQSEALLKQAIADALSLVKRILAVVKTKNPQLDLGLI
jgi:hypothetical protein